MTNTEMTGFVALVGGGPGDPELLTRRAVTLLSQADVVLYDALVWPETLELAPRAAKICVGKRANRASTPQHVINKLMVKAAQRGKRVVRLKGGDPFVFGRGGEEALALAAANIPFEIVPGISSAIAAPALAGIPVTHRGVASGFLVIAGHDEAAVEALLPAVPTAAPRALTLVVLMGIRQRKCIAELLVGRGWSPRTPAAIVFSASGRDSFVWRGCLAELGTMELDAEIVEDPGTLVIGEVVSVSNALLRSELLHGSLSKDAALTPQVPAASTGR